MDFSNESRNLQIANYIQTLRLEQNLTLEQLSDASHIPIVHLTSIEKGRFNRFDDFFLKMYLKKYTQTLGVDLEQLYTYAIQQPIEELPKKKKEELAEPVADPGSMQHKVQSQPTALMRPSRQKPQVRQCRPTVYPFGPTHTKAKVNMGIGKILIGFFFVALIAVFLIFMVDFFRNIGNREALPEEQPPVLEIRPELNLDPDNDDEADYVEEEEPEEETEEEPEPDEVPEDETTIELDEHTGRTQTFTVSTSADVIELRMEHSGYNWVSGPINAMLSGLFEETFELEALRQPDNTYVLNLPVGAIENIDAILINGEEVPFISDELAGPENLDFIITIQSE